MSTNLHPDVAAGLLRPKQKSETERTAERATGEAGKPDTEQPASSEDILEEAATQNDKRSE